MSGNLFHDIGVVILGAGQGKRLNCTELPKVMHAIADKPLVSFIIDTLLQSGVPGERVYLVVGFQKEKVMSYFGDKVRYAVQKELLGTAHAAFTGMKELPEDIKHVLVLNGDDTAFYKSETLLNLIERHKEAQAGVTLLSVEPDNYTQMGRIVRHPDGHMEIIEKEYLTDEQRLIKETSTGTFCFDREWFLQMFLTMPRLRKLGEFGLPTTFAMAYRDGKKAQVIKLANNNEWFGVNTHEELEEADKRMKLRLTTKVHKQ